MPQDRCVFRRRAAAEYFAYSAAWWVQPKCFSTQPNIATWPFPLVCCVAFPWPPRFAAVSRKTIRTIRRANNVSKSTARREVQGRTPLLGENLARAARACVRGHP